MSQDMEMSSSNKLRFYCVVCGQSFGDKDALKRHEMVHQDKGPFSCDVCHKSFLRFTTLRMHKKSHIGEKTFKSESSDKSFSIRDDLVTHKNSHTCKQSKDYSICDKQNISQNSMGHHQLCHMGELPNISNICDKAIATSDKLRVHEVSHTDTNMFKCDICGRSFMQLESYNKHTQGDAEFICKLCDYRFCNIMAFIRHKKKTHTVGAVYRCSICDTVLPDISLKTHVKSHENQRPTMTIDKPTPFACEISTKHPLCHTSDLPFRCYICDKTFAKKVELEVHKVLHTEKNVFKCDICKKSSLLIGDYIEHMQCHEKFICIFCGKQLSSKEGLDCHRQSHTEMTVYHCSTCEVVFSSITRLHLHIISHHNRALTPIGKNKFKCDICGNSFKQIENYNNHRQCELFCKLCCKRFCFKRAFAGHKGSHTADTVYHCSICDTVFPDAIFKAHIKSHENEKPIITIDKLKVYACEIVMKHLFHTGDQPFVCGPPFGKVFATRETLNLHEVSHAERNMFKCDFCGRSFLEMMEYNEHLQCHTKFICNFCGKQFFRTKELVQHKKAHTGETVYRCSACDAVFSDTTSLQVHMISHDNQIPTVTCETQIEVHEVSHADNNGLKCDICGESFLQIGEYNEHLQYHAKFICDFCGKHFQSKETFASHKIIHKEKIVYNCSTCNAAFSDTTSLQAHIISHGSLTPTMIIAKQIEVQDKNVHMCYICKMSFMDIEKYHEHLYCHAKFRSFVCSFCDERFDRKKALAKHKRNSCKRNIITYSCCNTVFTDITSLRTHRKSHENQTATKTIDKRIEVHKELYIDKNVFKCDICEKSSLHIGEYNEHLQYHGKFICIFCGKQFPNEDVLATHRQTHAGERVFSCSTCNAVFSSLTGLHIHIISHDN